MCNKRGTAKQHCGRREWQNGKKHWDLIRRGKKLLLLGLGCNYELTDMMAGSSAPGGHYPVKRGKRCFIGRPPTSSAGLTLVSRKGWEVVPLKCHSLPHSPRCVWGSHRQITKRREAQSILLFRVLSLYPSNERCCWVALSLAAFFLN